MTAKRKPSAAKSADPIISMIARLRRLAKKMDAACEKRDEIESQYPVGWFDSASVVVSMLGGGSGQRKEPIFAHSHEELDRKRQSDLNAFSSIMRADRDAAWMERFNARWRALHTRLDGAQAEQLERRKSARHNNTGATYQDLEDERASALAEFHKLRTAILKTVPKTREGHLFKVAFFLAELGDGLDLSDPDASDIREAMNGLPGIPKWKRYSPDKDDKGDDA